MEPDEIDELNQITKSIKTNKKYLRPFQGSKKKNCSRVRSFRTNEKMNYRLVLDDYKFKLSYDPMNPVPFSKISKGTCYSNELFYNFYRTKINSCVSYRFGINVETKDPDVFRKLTDIIYTKEQKDIICLSLIGFCETFLCKSFSKVKKDFYNEDRIAGIENHSKIEHFEPFFLPIRPTKMFHVKLFDSDINKKLNQQQDQNQAGLGQFTDIIRTIDINHPDSIFKGLVKFFTLYYLNKGRYVLAFHCKSGKDRTGLVDALQKATCFYVMKFNKKNLDYDESEYEYIRNAVPYFLLASLLIVYYSIGIFGIKLGHLPLAKYIFKDKKDLLDVFRGPF
jgi:hypothetical protein